MDKKPTFKPEKVSFVRTSRFYDVGASVAFFAGTALEIPLKGRFDSVPEGVFAISFGILACLMLVLKNFLEHKNLEERHNPTHLNSFVRSLFPILEVAGPNHGEPKLRLALYIPNGNGHLVVTDSKGFDEVDLKPIERTKGVVGRAAREKKLVVVQLPTRGNPDVVDFFVRHMSFERAEAIKHDQSRRSWAAVPVMNEDTLEAVLYCDSVDRDFFGNANSVRRKILEAAVVGVADFIRNR